MKNMRKSYKSTAHVKYTLAYHIILVPKYRKHPFTGEVKKTLKTALFEVAKNNHFKIENCAIEPNHVHLLIKTKPSVCISDIVCKLKSHSARELWKKHEKELRKYYWKTKHVLWTNGYFVSSVGEMSESTVREYLENQG